MRNIFFVVALVVTFLMPVVAYAQGLATSVTLSANPDSIVADGKSVTTVTVDVRDHSGHPVPDGSLISLSTDIGTIQASVTTVAGVARARLTSGTTVGTATISAWATTGGAVGQLKVGMLAPGTEVSRESFLAISSKKYLIYDSDKSIIYASGGADIKFRGLNIVADEAQVDIAARTVKCRMASGGEMIRLTRGHRTLDVRILVLRMTDGTGEAVVESETGKLRKVTFRASDLATDPDTAYRPSNYYDFADTMNDGVIIKATSIVYRPGEDLRMRNAQVFVDGKKVLAVRNHVVPLGGVTTEMSRYIGWGTSGLRVDLPYFYSLSADGTGSVRLRRGQQVGWGFYSANQGWSLDVVQDYTNSSGASGGMAVNRITNGDWGVQWHHNQPLSSGGEVYSYIDFPAHKDLFATTTISQPVGQLNFGANLYASKWEGQQIGLASDLYVQTNSKPIAKGLANYVLRAKTSFASAGQANSLGGSGTGLQMQLTGHQLKLAKSTNVTTSLTLGETLGGRYAGPSVLGTAGLMHQMHGLGTASLAYSYTMDNGSLGMFGQHRLSGNLMLTPSGRLQANIYGTYTLDKPMSSAFADASYHFLPTWKLTLLQTVQKFGISRYTDTEVGIGKTIAGHDMMLVWSKSKNKLRVEFSAARF